MILFEEVHPACFTNLLSAAGVWSGFDVDWLQTRILTRRRAALRWPTLVLPGRSTIRSLVSVLLSQVAELRGQAEE